VLLLFVCLLRIGLCLRASTGIGSTPTDRQVCVLCQVHTSNSLQVEPQEQGRISNVEIKALGLKQSKIESFVGIAWVAALFGAALDLCL
jgi:hypothetical protein